jgi:hypothetical protein
MDILLRSLKVGFWMLAIAILLSSFAWMLLSIYVVLGVDTTPEKTSFWTPECRDLSLTKESISMAAMTTALTEFADNGNSRTYTYTGHDATDPHLVLQRRKVATGLTSVIEDTVSVLSGSEDAAGDILASLVLFTATVKRPVNGIAGDVTAALAIFRDVIAGDEFANTVTTQEWLI